MPVAPKHLIFAVIAGVITSGVVTYVLSPTSAKGRRPSSIQRPLKFASKVGAPFRMAISQLSESPTTLNEELHLRGFITLTSEPEAEVFYEWSLPSGVRHVAGEISDSHFGVKNGETLTVDLSVDHVSLDENQILTLTAWYINKQGIKKSFSTAISTRPELTYSGRLEQKAQEELLKDNE